MIGYTDADGSPAYNLALSRRRARAVADYLVARGVNRDRIKVLGRGEADAIAPSDTPDHKRQNRRVVVALVKHTSAKLEEAQ